MACRISSAPMMTINKLMMTLNRAGETRLTSRTPANVLYMASGRNIAVNVIFCTLNWPKAA